LHKRLAFRTLAAAIDPGEALEAIDAGTTHAPIVG
jgi:hypothetical protein